MAVPQTVNRVAYNPVIPPRYIAKRAENTCSHKNVYMFVAAMFLTAKVLEQEKFQMTNK